MKQKLQPLKGRFLISEPALMDFYFGKSVVLLVEHDDEEGTFGLIINKPVHLKLNEVIKDFPKIDFPLFLGGPVHPDRLFYLHTLGDKIPGCQHVFDNMYWGGDINKIIEMIDLKLATPADVKFFIGYSGWEAGQLNKEMEQKSWIVTHASLKCVVAKKPEILWTNILKKMGNEYAIWAHFPSDPILN
jgi:putative transcriptional regulator